MNNNCFRVVVCLNKFFRKIQLACSEVSFSLLEINLLLKFDFFFFFFFLKYELSISNQINLGYTMFCRIVASVWKLPEVKVKHCGLLPLM